MNLKPLLSPIEVDPKFYIIVLSPSINGQFHVPGIQVYTGVHHTLELAKFAAKESVRKISPRFLKDIDFSWSIITETIISATEIESLFSKASILTEMQKKTRKNHLMKLIVDTNNSDLFERRVSLFTPTEKKYIQNKISPKHDAQNSRPQ